MTTAAPSPANLPVPPPRRVVHRDPYPLAVAAQAVTIFGIVGAALALAVATASIERTSLPGFLDSNTLPDRPRMMVFAIAGLGAVLSGLFALVYVLIRGRGRVAGLRQAADIILPLGVAAVIPSLFSARPWHDK